jgi:basic amino acid/polyamine antiporter, APA family
MEPSSGPVPVNTARKTLGLSGLTMHAMTLVSPGAFVWFLYPLQAAVALFGSAADIWPGVLLALLIAFITMSGFSGLIYRYPLAGSRSAYHFTQCVLDDFANTRKPAWFLPAKLVSGWSAHMFYWIYPGVLVAFFVNIWNYLLQQFGYSPTGFGEVLLAVAISAFVGFLALRGITGSNTSSVILNFVQIAILVIFAIMLIVFRVTNPDQFTMQSWQFVSLKSIFIPGSINGLLFQAAIAFFLVSGFEATAALGAYSANPGKDITRSAFIALLIQGVLSYLVQYFALNLALNPAFFNGNNSMESMAASAAPLGTIAIQLGNRLLWDNGFALMIVLASAVIISLLAAMLTALNNAVRVSFAMSLDADIRGVMGVLPAKYSTPTWAVILLSLFSAVIGSLGALGGSAVLLGITLAANMGAFALYAFICVLAVIPTPYRPFSIGKSLPALFGALCNVGMLAAMIKIGFSYGGMITQAIWLVVGFALFFLVVTLLVRMIQPKQSGI